jgi:transposase
MEQATTIGLDIAKHVFQVHGADAAGHVLFRKRFVASQPRQFAVTIAVRIVGWPVALKSENRNDRGSSSLELVAGKV